jgi:hypothetical protein
MTNTTETRQQNAYGCVVPSAASPQTLSTLDIQFLELDMSSIGMASCSGCVSAETQLNAAVAELRPLFDQIGVGIQFDKKLVTTAEEAQKLRLIASPTIRIHGRDLVPETQNVGYDLRTDSRVWAWKDDQYPVPPKAMLLDAILHAYPLLSEPLPTSASEFELPQSLRDFFEERSTSTGATDTGCGCTG